MTIIEERVMETMQEFTRTSPMGSVTTGMLNLLVKPNCTSDEFIDLLDHMEHRGLLKGMPKGRTKRWKLD